MAPHQRQPPTRLPTRDGPGTAPHQRRPGHGSPGAMKTDGARRHTPVTSARQMRRMGHRDASHYRWRCMLTASPRTAVSTKDASFDGVWGQNSLVFLLCFMFSLRLERNETSKMIWDFENGTSRWDFKLYVKRSVNGQETRSSWFQARLSPGRAERCK